MKVYTYWVNKNGSTMPDYIKLCMYTWELAVPNVHVEIINHENISQYLPAELLTESFYKLSLAMQSDVVSVWVLMSRGGIFIDADTIMTGDPFRHSVFQSDKFVAFGYPERKSIHLAILFSPQPKNPILVEWSREIFRRLSLPLPEPLPWHYVGNGIVNEILNNPAAEGYFEIIDAGASGNILELMSDKEDAYLRYIDFYFSTSRLTLEDVLPKVHFNLISLHNSWTPDPYRQANLEMIVKTKDSIFMSHLLMHLFDKLSLTNQS